MYTRTENYFSGFKDTQLFYQAWESPKPKGHVIITHGHGEHSECYQRLVNFFEEDSWSFYAWDLRGHGRSEGNRGYAEDFENYCSDYLMFLRHIMQNPSLKKGPVIFLAHSMGGLIQTKTLIDHHQYIPQASVLSAPLFGLSLPVPIYKSYGAQLLNILFPKVTLGNEISNEFLSRDPDILKEYDRDPLRHSRMSSGVYLGMQNAIKYIHLRARTLRYPTLLQISESDPIVSHRDAQKVFETFASPMKKMITYSQDARHELYNDVIRNEVYADLKKFINQFI